MTPAIRLVGSSDDVGRVVAAAADLLAGQERRDWFVAVGRMAGERRAELERDHGDTRGSRTWLVCWVTALILGGTAAFTGAAAILPGKHESLSDSRDDVPLLLQVAVPMLWVAVPLLALCALARIPRSMSRPGVQQSMAVMCAVLGIGVPTLALVLASWSSYATHVEPVRLTLWASLLAGAQILAAVGSVRLWRRFRTEPVGPPTDRPTSAHLEAARLANTTGSSHPVWQRHLRALNVASPVIDQAITLGPTRYLVWAYYGPGSEHLPRPTSFLHDGSA